jgi:DnaK suppressor protein
MTATLDVNKFKKLLEKQRKTLRERLNRNDDMDLSYNPDRSDLATQYTENQRDKLLTARAKQHLKDVEAALDRIKNGTYGKCDCCGRSIHPARLETMPTTALCIDCKTQLK